MFLFHSFSLYFSDEFFYLLGETVGFFTSFSARKPVKTKQSPQGGVIKCLWHSGHIMPIYNIMCCIDLHSGIA